MLFRCLLILAQLHERPCGEEALLSGLPLEEGKLTPPLFVRAAKRAGFAAEIVKRPLKDITAMVLPAVLLLQDQQACVLIETGENGLCQVIQPETGGGAMAMEVEQLQSHYDGYAIFVRPEYKFSERVADFVRPKDEHSFWGVIKKAWPVYSEVLLASLLINLFALAMPLFIMNVYDRVVPNEAMETLWVLGIGVLIVFSFDFVLRLLRAYFIDTAGKNVDVQLSAMIFEQILGLKMAARPQSVGAFANTVQAFESFRDFMTSASITALVDVPFVIIFLAVIGTLAGSVVLIPLVAIPLILGVSFFIQKSVNEKVKDMYRYAAEKQATLVESLYGAETIKAMAAEGTLQRKWEQVICLAAKLGVNVRTLSNLGITSATFIQQLATILVIIYGVYKITEGEITIGALIACTILNTRALSPMSQVASLVARYHQSRTAMTSLDSVMAAPVDRPQGKHYLQRQTLKVGVECRELSFAYPGQQVAVLNKVSFTIKPGEKVGIIGRIGSGKSTLGKVLLGLYEPSEGKVLMDGTDMMQMDPANIRHHVGYVPQDVTLFYGTVRENIALRMPHADSESIIKAATLSGTAEFVDETAEGYDFMLGERGENLSGGQRQTIAIARALLGDPPLLILDEPSNAMDDRTESYVRSQLEGYVEDKTLLVITHRASLLGLVDRLLVLERGRIVADGPKEEVLRALSEGAVRVK